jgi:hypothetical protein
MTYQALQIEKDEAGYRCTLKTLEDSALPEGYLLQVLQEQFGTHIGASPTALLSGIGRKLVGRTIDDSTVHGKADAPPINSKLLETTHVKLVEAAKAEVLALKPPYAKEVPLPG